MVVEPATQEMFIIDLDMLILIRMMVSLTQARIDMSELDEDSDGFLQPHESDQEVTDTEQAENWFSLTSAQCICVFDEHVRRQDRKQIFISVDSPEIRALEKEGDHSATNKNPKQAIEIDTIQR
ncbi:hypothetical protein V2J09_015738 [Rumex salicifolius]